MAASQTWEWKRVFSIGAIIIPVLIFLLVLTTKIPYFFSQIFLSYSIFLFVILVFLYSLCFHLPGRWSRLAGLSLTMLLFSLTLSYHWTSGFSNNKVMAGFLPYKDGQSYYGGAEMILNGLPIPAVGLQADGRPLFPGLLASLLFLTGHNLQWTLAIIIGFLGIFCYLSAERIFDSWGPLAAALYITLLYFYIQPLISTTLSELPGLAFGCLGLTFLWSAAENLNIKSLIFGLVILTLSLSIRAGAFFIFPMLILWAGWAFRGERRFSYRVAGIAFVTSMAAFLLLNIVYPRLVVAAGGATFGNFAYALYGQVLGGAGWHRAITDLQTRDPSVVYKAALEFFLKHPASFFIGIAKSYRDFFLPNSNGIFSFESSGGLNGVDILLWVAALILLIWGIVRSIREIRAPLPALLVAGFAGIFLSIPFLPPVDGGARFHASTMPFFFAIATCAASRMFKNQKAIVKAEKPLIPLQLVSILIFGLVVVLPVLLQRFIRPVPITMPACTAGQVPFMLKANPGSYVDLVPENSASCGLGPEICLSDFKANGVEKTVDDFYQELVVQAEASASVTRIEPTIDLAGKGFHFFMGTTSQLEPLSSDRLISGCATEIRTRTHSIYKVETVTP